MSIRLLLEHAEVLKKIQSLRDEADELEKQLPVQVTAFLEARMIQDFSRKKGRGSKVSTHDKDEAVLAAGKKAADGRGEFKRSEMKQHLSMEPYAGKTAHNTESDISNSLRRLFERGEIVSVRGKTGYYKITR